MIVRVIITKLLKYDLISQSHVRKMSKLKKSGRHAMQQTRMNRQKECLRWVQAVPSQAYLQVLGTDHLSPNGIYLFTDHRSYLFNCGEGVQRMAHEHKIKLMKFEHIFVTHNSWRNVGGLPGLTLTVQDMGVPKLNLHGPPTVEDIYKMTGSFVRAKYVEIEKHEHNQQVFEDGSLKVTYVPLRVLPENVNGNDSLVESSYESSHDESDSSCDSPSGKEPSSKRMKMDPDLQQAKNISIAYICKLHNKQGELIIQKCMELGVPVGPLLGRLKNGEDVTLENGQKVCSKDVVYPEEKGAVFIVVECPTEHFLAPLLNAEAFRPHQNSAADVSNIAEVVVHFTPQSILQHPQYLEWISRFSPQTHHLFLNELCSGLCSSSISKIQHKLHLVNSEIFPILECESESRLETWKNVRLDIPLAIFAEPMLIYRLRPRYGVDRSELVVANVEEFRKEVLENAKCVEKLAELHQKLNGSNVADVGQFPEVTFLGTGSSIPNKSRNVSGIVVHLSSNVYIMLDCGEGTVDQLARFYGSELYNHILRNLHAVFISHMHADHHMGLIKLLLEREMLLRAEGQKDTLYIIAPTLISSWLTAYSKKWQKLHSFKCISTSSLSVVCNPLDKEIEKMFSLLQVKEIKTVEVIHCKNAYGIVITDQMGRKLVYSGDTMPCESLIKAGTNCDVLIHEATMEDDLVQMARTKMHTTTSEAIEVSQKMKAKYTILTHFSQRYAKIPVFNENFNSSIGIAFDNMKVRWCDLPLLSSFIPVLKEVFSEEYGHLIDKQEKLKKRKIESE